MKVYKITVQEDTDTHRNEKHVEFTQRDIYEMDKQKAADFIIGLFEQLNKEMDEAKGWGS